MDKSQSISKANKIVFYIENDQHGGLDTFIKSLIKYWPNKNDRITLVHNYNHPGAGTYKDISKLCKIDKIRLPLSFTVSNFLFASFKIGIQKIFRPFLKLVFFPIQYKLIKSYFMGIDADLLMVINGGYPGGETCRVANIVWQQMYGNSRPNFHNFHNFAVKATFGTRWYENYIDKMLVKSISGIISVSYSCSLSINLRPEMKNFNATYIHNGIDFEVGNTTNPICQIKDLGVNNNQSCLMLANYEKRKGHEFVIKSFRKVLNELPDAHLFFCGAGKKEDKAWVKNLAVKYGVNQNTHIFDFIENGASLISFFDILLVGSQEFESFGLVVAEAMFAKVPVVSTSVGGLKEVLKDNVGGYLVPRNDDKLYSEYIIKLLNNERLRIEVGEKGFQRVQDMFNAKTMANNYHDRLIGNLEWIQKINKNKDK